MPKTILSILLVFAAVPELASAQQSFRLDNYYVDVYSAKFVCGRAASTPQQPMPVVDGIYKTTINIHNPNPLSGSSPVTVYKKIAVTFTSIPGTSESTGIQAIVDGSNPKGPESLKSDQVFEVDCNDIATFKSSNNLGMCYTGGFCEGYLVIEVDGPPTSLGTTPPAPPPINVVAVYTATTSSDADCACRWPMIHVERYKEPDRFLWTPAVHPTPPPPPPGSPR